LHRRGYTLVSKYVDRCEVAGLTDSITMVSAVVSSNVEGLRGPQRSRQEIGDRALFETVPRVPSTECLSLYTGIRSPLNKS